LYALFLDRARATRAIAVAAGAAGTIAAVDQILGTLK
jgi:hypothetical protein